MSTNPQSRWGLRLATFAAWALAAASVAYWGLKVSAPPDRPLVPVVASATGAPVDAARIARLLGATDSTVVMAQAAPASSRFLLVGVLAGISRTGTALIAVDGKPAKPFRVGAAVDTGYVLQSVGPRAAVLAASMDGPATVTVEMVAPKPAATGPGALPALQAPTRFVPPAAPANQPVINQPVIVPVPTVPGAPGMSPAAVAPAANSGFRHGPSSVIRAMSSGPQVQ